MSDELSAGAPGAVVLDVRPLISEGEEPFSTIMAAVDGLEGRALELHSPFEPVPLHRVLARRGLRHRSVPLADDHWVTYYEPEGGAEGTEHVLDVRGLDPPEPMVRTLAALEDLPEGATLVQINVRVPALLLPELDALGWSYEIQEGAEAVVTRISRGSGT